MPKPNPANASVARRLVQAREAAGLSFDAAVIRLAMHPQTYGYHEQGVTSVKPAELRRYAEAFGVSYGWLTTGIGMGPKKSDCGP
ncbi:helix-turn-helix transcriptional regulator [Lichenihabitans sp. Uapishka_5]|uniref:helix-turn-helix domain-containing protein n=1 Tax=Lichenihabitans sp. Uapishka_5 TaxID=3037302 RepID=UPI0029E80259|nr:helix-turn-helix transcriptional regulator [Lichenihabitans sp. Uapishka_5]MDX7952153.1 helix-turn-helix transcriptional regulator [Lichenihabitans sp. Uapishka_5]